MAQIVVTGEFSSALEETLAFAGCELRLATRELVRDGVVQPMEPRTWDLLVYLIMHRDRVVSKAELLDKVWRTPFISDTVVPQAVMKARQIIGDDSVEPHLVKTVHRVGYRFIGRVGVRARPDQAHAASAALHEPQHPQQPHQPHQPRVLAVLPFEDRTGDSTFAWVELGLMALAAKELEAAAGVRAVPTTELLHALERLPAGLDGAERALSVRRHFAADAAIQFTLFTEAGAYGVAWTVFREEGEVAERLAGHVPTALTIRAARQIAATLTRQHGAAAPQLFRIGQTFLNEAYGRALRARAEHHLEQAAKLLAVCVLAPDCPLEIQSEHLFLMAYLLDPATPQRAAHVLRQARAAGARREEGKALMSLCLFHLDDGDLKASEAAGDGALDLLSNADAPEDRGFALICRAQLAMSAHQFGYARRLIEEAQGIAEHVRSSWLRVWGVQQQGELEEFSGSPEAACGLYARSVEVARAAAVRDSVVFGDTSLAQMRLGQGRFQESRALVDEALAAAAETGHPRTQIVAHLTAVLVAARTADGALLAAERERLAVARLAVPKIGRGAIEISDALLATLAGRFDAALMHLAAASRLVRDQPRFWPDLRWIQVANLALLEGRPALAAEALEALEAHAGYATSRNKRGAASVIRALCAAAGQDDTAARGSAAEALGLAVADELVAVAGYLDAWLSLDRDDDSAYQRWRATAGDWSTATPAAALLEARSILVSGADLGACLEVRARLAAHGWQTTPWGADALVLLEEGHALTRPIAGRPHQTLPHPLPLLPLLPL